MARKPVKEYDQFQLRLPPGMRERIAHAAKERGTSMNTLVVDVLKDYFPDKVTVGHYIDQLSHLVKNGKNISAADKYSMLHAMDNIREIFEVEMGDDFNEVLRNLWIESRSENPE